MYEEVDYPGTPPEPYPYNFYQPPAPFNLLFWEYPYDPTKLPDPPEPMDAGTGLDRHAYWASAPPYTGISVIASQVYKYNDPEAGIMGATVPGPDSTATIVREILQTERPPVPGTHWFYHASKQGLDAWIRLD